MRVPCIILLLFAIMPFSVIAQTSNEMDPHLYEPSTYMDQRDFEMPVIKDGKFIVPKGKGEETIDLASQLRIVFYDSATKKYSLAPYPGFDKGTTYYCGRYDWSKKGDNKLFEIDSRENGSVTDHWEEPVWYRRAEWDKKKNYYREKLEYMPTHKYVSYDPDIANGFEVKAVYQNLASNDILLLEGNKNNSVLNIFIAKPNATAFTPLAKLNNANGLENLYATSAGEQLIVICKRKVMIVNTQTGITELEFDVPEHDKNDLRIYNKNNTLCVFVASEKEKTNFLFRLNPAKHTVDTVCKNTGGYYPHVYIGDDLKTALAVRYGTGKGVSGHQLMQYVSLSDMSVLATAVSREDLHAYESGDSLSNLFAQLAPAIRSFAAEDIKAMEQKGYTLCAQSEKIKFSKDSVYTYVVYFPNAAYLSLNFEEFDNVGNKKSSSWSVSTDREKDKKYLNFLYDNKLVRAQVNFTTDKGYYATLKDFIIWSTSGDISVAGYFNSNKRFDIRYYKKKREAGDNDLVVKEMPYTNYVFPPEQTAKTSTPSVPAGKKICSACQGRKYAAATVEVSCKYCSGRGRMRCQTCNGTAAMYNIYTHRTVACPKCLAGYSSCPDCGGTGKIKDVDPTAKCTKCKGLGYN